MFFFFLFFMFCSICIRVKKKMFPPLSEFHGSVVSSRHRAR